MSGDLTVIAAAVACGAVTVTAEPVTIPVLCRIAVFDVPGRRLPHAVPTPCGGGVPAMADPPVPAVPIGGTAGTGGMTVGAWLLPSGATQFVPALLGPAVVATRRYDLLSRHPRVRAEQVRAEQVQRLCEDKAYQGAATIRGMGLAPLPFAGGILADAGTLGLAA